MCVGARARHACVSLYSFMFNVSAQESVELRRLRHNILVSVSLNKQVLLRLPSITQTGMRGAIVSVFHQTLHIILSYLLLQSGMKLKVEDAVKMHAPSFAEQTFRMLEDVLPMTLYNSDSAAMLNVGSPDAQW